MAERDNFCSAFSTFKSGPGTLIYALSQRADSAHRAPCQVAKRAEGREIDRESERERERGREIAEQQRLDMIRMYQAVCNVRPQQAVENRYEEDGCARQEEED